MCRGCTIELMSQQKQQSNPKVSFTITKCAQTSPLQQTTVSKLAVQIHVPVLHTLVATTSSSKVVYILTRHSGMERTAIYPGIIIRHAMVQAVGPCIHIASMYDDPFRSCASYVHTCIEAPLQIPQAFATVHMPNVLCEIDITVHSYTPHSSQVTMNPLVVGPNKALAYYKLIISHIFVIEASESVQVLYIPTNVAFQWKASPPIATFHLTPDIPAKACWNHIKFLYFFSHFSEI